MKQKTRWIWKNFQIQRVFLNYGIDDIKKVC